MKSVHKSQTSWKQINDEIRSFFKKSSISYSINSCSFNLPKSTISYQVKKTVPKNFFTFFNFIFVKPRPNNAVLRR